MIRLILICSVTQVIGDVSMEHSVFMSRKSRSDSSPTRSGYKYSRVNNQPGIVSTYGHGSELSEPFIASYGTPSSKEYFSPPNFEDVDPEITRPTMKRTVEITEPVLTNYAVDAAISEAEAKYNSKFFPSKMKTDAMYDRLRSIMHYHLPDNTLETPLGYDMNDYHLDEDDVRTSSRGLYDNWPYFYHSPYEYEHMKIDSEIEKAKDKRYVVDTMSVIPVHEKVDDVPDAYEYNMIDSHHESTDNPIHGNAPFFSFVLNDYFNKNNEDDPLTFKGIEWGKDFDYQPKISDSDEYTKIKRQDQSSDKFYSPNVGSISPSYLSNTGYSNTLNKYGESSTEKSYENKNKFDKFEKSDDHKQRHSREYEHNGKLYKSFKDFIDSFANKFGREDHKKDSKYLFNMNQDKGENKKGFRRVYHKDEYQEDNDFYDNNNKSVKAEESGSSKAHVGGSEAVLKSHAAAALGDEGNNFNNAHNKNDKFLENNHKGHDFNKGNDSQFNRFRDVAKKTAQSNIADYSDHYRI